jgi:Predicted amidohydrolase
MATLSTRTARIGCVQWRMRLFTSIDDFLKQAETIVASLASYRCDVALFPEFFTAPLMGLTPGLPTLQQMRTLATHTPHLVDAFSAMAQKHHINIIAGSMPQLDGELLYNVAWLCRRDGTRDSQYKIHPTPGERADWNMQGGDRLSVFDTDFGRIGILICYDVEFPELPRLQMEQGMDILFVPFWTDSKYGYQRVRFCAQARAIENECYVVLAGSTGVLPEVESLDVQYAQSAIFTPSDYGFPHDAVVMEATTNVETTLVADLDLHKLKPLRRAGSVRNGEDRRRDLYAVSWLGNRKA